jgi:hypothetical protein
MPYMNRIVVSRARDGMTRGAPNKFNHLYTTTAIKALRNALHASIEVWYKHCLQSLWIT